MATSNTDEDLLSSIASLSPPLSLKSGTLDLPHISDPLLLLPQFLAKIFSHLSDPRTLTYWNHSLVIFLTSDFIKPDHFLKTKPLQPLFTHTNFCSLSPLYSTLSFFFISHANFITSPIVHSTRHN